jgi:hypothetical protein
MTAATAISAVTAASSFASAAVSAVAVASATSARLYKLSVKAFCKFLLGSFTYAEHFSLEMECLACHLMVEVHLD